LSHSHTHTCTQTHIHKHMSKSLQSAAAAATAATAARRQRQRHTKRNVAAATCVWRVYAVRLVCVCVCVCMCEGMPLYFYYVMPKRKIIQKRNVSSRRLSFDSLHFLYVSRYFFWPAVLFLIGNKRLLLLLLFLIGAYWGRSQTDFTLVCVRVCMCVCEYARELEFMLK